MLAFVKYLFLCLLAVLAGVAAVSIPIEGRTVAERVRDLAENGKQAKVAAGSEKASARPKKLRFADRPPAEDPTEEEREALDRLIGDRVR